ncbi:hypothetical protein [Chromobacterium vaccinii]|uniref:hypothetical protein n=1 Tax=Chromobacterium vaccinii TaxID=1108595 RepID=UPI001319EBE0|nr:hypothetical protein [Chromobacterium vaccinii]
MFSLLSRAAVPAAELHDNASNYRLQTLAGWKWFEKSSIYMTLSIYFLNGVPNVLPAAATAGFGRRREEGR